jgi:exodeoxyribonuclease VII small subunit
MATTRGSGAPRPGAEDESAGVVDLSYSDAGAELDAIIEEFETGVIDVDRLVDQLQRATDIVDELDRRLRHTRMKVEELVPRLEAIGQDDGPDQGEVEFEEAMPPDLPDDADGESAPAPGLF